MSTDQKTETAKPKKKHRLLKFFVILTGIIIAIAILSPGDDDDGGTTAAPAGDGEQAQDAAQESTQEKAPGIGDEAVDGDFTFVVESVTDGPDQIGDEAFGVTPQGKFMLVEMTVTNHGDSAGTFFGDNQYLVDTEGRKASADSEAAIYLEDSQSLLEEINPGNSVTGTVVFDIPADATPASLELHDSMLSGGVTVAVGT